jgi:hypothetical protein
MKEDVNRVRTAEMGYARSVEGKPRIEKIKSEEFRENYRD